MATISLRKARTIIRKTMEKGREMDLKPLSVVVLDAGGNVIAFERQLRNENWPITYVVRCTD